MGLHLGLNRFNGRSSSAFTLRGVIRDTEIEAQLRRIVESPAFKSFSSSASGARCAGSPPI